MILKIRKKDGFVYVDNMYMVQIDKINKAAFRGSEDGERAIWIEEINPETNRPEETGYYVTCSKYMYEYECRTVKSVSYVIDSGYLLNDNGKTVEAIYPKISGDWD